MLNNLLSRNYSVITVKFLIEAPGFYSNKLLLPPACIRDPAYIGDPASIKTLSTCHTRVKNFFYI